MKILGLNIFHPDSSATLIVDNKIVSAAEEERFTKIKHYSGFPINSIKYCLEESKISLDDIDFIAVNYNKKYNLKEKVIFGLKNINLNYVNRLIFLVRKSNLETIFYDEFKKNIPKEKFQYIPHHISHIASSYFFSGFDDCSGFSFDASGDFSTAETYSIKNNKIQITKKAIFPHSMGIFYQALTQFLGFKNYGEEYKFMGLSSYGKPNYLNEVKKLIRFDNDNLFKMNLDYFLHHKKGFSYNFDGHVPVFADLYSKKMEEIFGEERKMNEPLNQKHMDISCSVQKVFEDIVFKILANLYNENESQNLCVAGGCANNSSLNGKLLDKTKFSNIYISSNVGDAGGALGAAAYVNSIYNKKVENFKISNFSLGPSFSDEEVKTEIESSSNKDSFNSKFNKDFNELTSFVTDKIIDGKVIAWFQGRMEFGPRALGNRSIIADPRIKNMRDLINIKVKRREEFRPFAPSILEENFDDYFIHDIKKIPFMNYVVKVKKEKFDEIPSVIHVDGTSRVQTVSEKDNYRYYQLIKNFYKKTSVPILLNTSFNVNGPINCTPKDAINCFLDTNIDCLVMGNYILTKKNA
mgnify:CR=1 FL=1|jgi:carbamoyltransferase